MNTPIEWLLDGPAWVQYRTRLDLLDQPADAPEVVAARRAAPEDGQIQTLLAELAEWPGPPLTRHNDASHLLHKLVFAADLGIRIDDPGVGQIVEKVLGLVSPEGAFQMVFNIPRHYGGAGEDQKAWMLCDAPLVLYALARFGLEETREVRKAANHLASLIRENGWPCAVAPVLGRFRGPGRKGDPCPYANLVALRALAQIPEWRDGDACRTGVETLLTLWAQRRERRPYLFAMGADFAKLKAPLVWYDILHVADVLTQFPWLRQDQRLREMVETVEAKADDEGRFRAESIWTAWKGWEFGQKRAPSRWITLLAQRVLARMEA